MFLRTFPTVRKRLTATSTTELFEPLTPWFHCVEVLSAISAVLVLANKSGNFQLRFGIQSAATDVADASNPLNPSSVATQITTAPTRTLVRFDPNGASDGNIDTAAYFRVGVMYSLSSGSTPGQGDIELQGLCWR